MSNTKIPYLATAGKRGKAWNPTVGCTPVSAGCANCWARTLHQQRLRSNLEASAAHMTPKRARELDVRLPFPRQYDLPFSVVQLLPDRFEEPLHWRKPQRVAVCFGSDLFHKDVLDDYILRVFMTMMFAEEHDFLLLTKRPERMQAWFATERVRNWCGVMQEIDEADDTDQFCWPLPNVWLGVSVEDQATADERIPLLLKTPAAKRWLSAEPLLEALDLTSLGGGYLKRNALTGLLDGPGEVSVMRDTLPGLDYLVIGGESGPKHRPMEIQWARSLREQCYAAGVRCWFKQVSATRPGQPSGVPALDMAKEVPDGAKPS